jgi:hypothetical protein
MPLSYFDEMMKSAVRLLPDGRPAINFYKAQVAEVFATRPLVLERADYVERLAMEERKRNAVE